MNWYKKAKLIDKKSTDDIASINSQCSYCGRWLVHPYGVLPDKSNTTWIAYDQLDNEERSEADRVTSGINKVSHGICNYCLDIILDSDTLSIPSGKVKELSLGLGNAA